MSNASDLTVGEKKPMSSFSRYKVLGKLGTRKLWELSFLKYVHMRPLLVVITCNSPSPVTDLADEGVIGGSGGVEFRGLVAPSSARRTFLPPALVGND